MLCWVRTQPNHTQNMTHTSELAQVVVGIVGVLHRCKWTSKIRIVFKSLSERNDSWLWSSTVGQKVNCHCHFIITWFSPSFELYAKYMWNIYFSLMCQWEIIRVWHVQGLFILGYGLLEIIKLKILDNRCQIKKATFVCGWIYNVSPTKYDVFSVLHGRAVIPLRENYITSGGEPLHTYPHLPGGNLVTAS